MSSLIVGTIAPNTCRTSESVLRSPTRTVILIHTNAKTKTSWISCMCPVRNTSNKSADIRNTLSIMCNRKVSIGGTRFPLRVSPETRPFIVETLRSIQTTLTEYIPFYIPFLQKDDTTSRTMFQFRLTLFKSMPSTSSPFSYPLPFSLLNTRKTSLFYTTLT